MKDIYWPEKIADTSRALKIANMLMVIFYVIGVGFTGSTVLGALYRTFSDGRISACGNLVVGIVGPVILHLLAGD